MEKMSNIIDYVRRMKDVPFEIAPLNEIDSLIFSQLAYLDYSLLPTKESYSFLEIYNSNLVPLLVKELGMQKTIAYYFLRFLQVLVLDQ